MSTLRLELAVTIRPCREDDLPGMEWFGRFADHRQIIRDAFDLQQAGLAVMLLAEANHHPVGQAWLDLRPRPAAVGPMVWAVRVLEPLQGLGIGARLMAGIEAAARQRGHAAVELGVDRDNAAARAFYERLGWRVFRQRRDSYGYTTPDGRTVVVPLEEWVMAKRIDQPAGVSPTRA
ncbi:MAG: acetyltransferase, family [Phenylobacterium sp.]|jgi:GNAT superfamily N-acetyltransferase|nr:acetyltransferase, family [Phenylobacterium sp.]